MRAVIMSVWRLSGSFGRNGLAPSRTDKREPMRVNGIHDFKEELEMDMTLLAVVLAACTVLFWDDKGKKHV